MYWLRSDEYRRTMAACKPFTKENLRKVAELLRDAMGMLNSSDPCGDVATTTHFSAASTLFELSSISIEGRKAVESAISCVDLGLICNTYAWITQQALLRQDTEYKEPVQIVAQEGPDQQDWHSDTVAVMCKHLDMAKDSPSPGQFRKALSELVEFCKPPYSDVIYAIRTYIDANVYTVHHCTVAEVLLQLSVKHDIGLYTHSNAEYTYDTHYDALIYGVWFVEEQRKVTNANAIQHINITTSTAKRHKPANSSTHRLLRVMAEGVREFLTHRQQFTLSTLSREWDDVVPTCCLCVPGRLQHWQTTKLVRKSKYNQPRPSTSLHGWLTGCTIMELIRTLSPRYPCKHSSHLRFVASAKREFAYVVSCCSGTSWVDICTILRMHPTIAAIHWGIVLSSLPRPPTMLEVSELISDTRVHVDTRFMLWSHTDLQVDASVRVSLLPSQFLTRADTTAFLLPEMNSDMFDLIMQYVMSE
jgi:hypothetical protein